MNQPGRGGAPVRVEGLSWRPAGRRTPVLTDLDLSVPAGQKVLLAGPSGAGKSTLLRAIAGLLRANEVGDLDGRVGIDGRDPQEVPGQVGLLLQDPSAAVVAGRVGRDVAFGLENICLPRPAMPARVRRALEAAHFPYGEQRGTTTLSGGELQRLALAGALALGPRVLLLDEPTAMLDDDNSAKVRASVLDVVADRQTTLIVVEHRIEPWVEHVDRAIVLGPDGQLVADGPPGRVLAEQGADLARHGIWVPGLPAPEPAELDAALVAPEADALGAEPLVRAEDVVVRYRSAFGGRPDAPEVSATDVGRALDGVSVDLRPGTTTALTGPSGAGKSTLLAVLAGLQRPGAGTARVPDRLAGRRGRDLWRLTSAELAGLVGWVPQLPEHGLVRHAVLDELLVTPRALGRAPDRSERRARDLLEALALGHLAEANTHRLSGGEQRRLVVAAALTHGPRGLLLDEPTVGQDRLTWAAVLGACRSAARAGAAVALASHDRAAVEQITADGGRRVCLDRGRIVRAAR